MKQGIPPQDIHAEKCLIGSFLLVSNVLDEVGAILDAEDFYLDTHKSIFRAAMAMHGKNSPVDAELLADALNKSGKLSECGGVDYLIDCMSTVPHAAHAVHYAKIVAEKSQRRALSFAGTDAVHLAADMTKPVDESVAHVEQSVTKILERTAGDEVEDIGTILTRALHRIDGGQARGLLARFKGLDDLTNGFEAGNLVVLAARPSIGKTALAVNIVHKLSADGMSVGFASLEQTPVEIAERLLGLEARVGTDELRGIGLTEAQRDSLLQAAQAMSDRPLTIDGCEYRGIAAIEASARLMVRRYKIKLFVVDYLQMIQGQDRRQSREQEVAEVSGRLKWLAKSLSIPVLALCQLNRESEKRPDKRPRLSDLRESGAIEQDADIVLLLHRDEFYDPEMNPGEAQLSVAKNRNGRTGEVKLHFDKRLMMFKDLAPEYVARSAPSFDWQPDPQFEEYV